MPGPDFIAALDICLASVASGKETALDCIAAHPEFAEELESLLPLANSISYLPSDLPSPERRAVARVNFVEALHAEGRPRRFAWLLRSMEMLPRYRTLPVAASLALVLLAMAGTGAAFASQSAGPASPLYPVKIAIEQLQVTTTFGEEQKARLEIQMADRRLAEIDSALTAGDPAAASAAASVYDATIASVQDRLSRAADTSPEPAAIEEEIVSTLEKQETIARKARDRDMDGVASQLSNKQRTPGGAAVAPGSKAPTGTATTSPTPPPAQGRDGKDAGRSRPAVAPTLPPPPPTATSRPPTATPHPPTATAVPTAREERAPVAVPERPRSWKPAPTATPSDSGILSSRAEGQRDKDEDKGQQDQPGVGDNDRGQSEGRDRGDVRDSDEQQGPQPVLTPARGGPAATSTPKPAGQDEDDRRNSDDEKRQKGGWGDGARQSDDNPDDSGHNAKPTATPRPSPTPQPATAAPTAGRSGNGRAPTTTAAPRTPTPQPSPTAKRQATPVPGKPGNGSGTSNGSGNGNGNDKKTHDD